MADKKISELTNITGANVDDANDEIAIVDASASETKAITREELFSSVSSMSLSGGTIDGITIGGTTASSGTFTDLTVDEATLTAIAETKSDTAVDVFVYDTSQDSDGGAWRHRTQHTSWYNETLNTATRGARREFPAVAVIVAENDKVTIYDGDDPSLPMWMVFNEGNSGSNFNFIITGGSNSISTLNARLSLGVSSNALVEIDFLKDAAQQRYSNGMFFWADPISKRNSTPLRLGGTNASAAIVDSTVNDVAMTVLPDAPIDPATGLPVPTIAVATAGGVSVIKDDGTVADGGDLFAMVSTKFSDDGLYYSFGNGALYFATYADIESGDGFGDQVYAGSSANSLPQALTRAQTIVTDKTDFYAGGTSVSAEAKVGLWFASQDSSNRLSGLGCLLTSTYNTGWMNGDIKLAALSDTDDTDLVGSGELVTNGTFDTDTSGWSAGNGAALSVDAGRLKVTNGSFGYADHQVTVEVGTTYSFTFEAEAGLGAWEVRLGTPTAPSKYKRLTFSPGSGVVTFKAVSTTVVIRLLIYTSTSGDYAFFDNISVKLADEDRSVNNNGLIVNGTVTRSPVASGADLVAYSGFSTSNYLEQPYNSDLDFGTGDFCVMGWVTASGASDWLVDRKTPGSVNSAGFEVFQVGGFSSSGTFQIKTRDGSSNTDTEIGVVTSEWTHFVAARKSGVMYTYINGVLQNSGVDTTDVTNTSASLFIGMQADASSSFLNGSSSLLRISATAPTAEQIAKIYEDEKFLFQENAQATLYGTSDAVTALAHDPVTDLLHVGTSDGRSVFQGLRRVDNTTDAVSTAISASNNLIVEQ